ncbi:MAG: hypothetical protein AB7L09_01225 [Nitrospira sp.]
MRYTRLVIGILATLLAVCGVAFADGPSVTPQVPGNVVPAWVFYWVLGLSSAAGATLLLVIKILWDKADKTSGLSEDERNKLNELYKWHNKVDDDQVPLWYTPRSWVNLIQGLQQDHAAVKVLLTKIVEQNSEVNAELRQQVRDAQERQDRLQAKTLRIAVRVQQAVEALAGLAPPRIEDALDDPRDDA